MKPVRLASAILLTLFLGLGNVQAKDRPPLPPDAYYFGDSAYAIHKIDDRIFAIGEPTYYQGNVSYLFVGTQRALLLDGGASREEDITKVVASLTDKPVAVIPSHLHFDHMAGLDKFKEVWLVDLPYTRDLADKDGTTTVPVGIDLHDIDKLSPSSFRVARYVAPDEIIDLGELKLQLLSTPGHTKDEISLWKENDDMLFVGDFLYPGPLFVGNVKDYLASLDKALGVIGSKTKIYGAHGSAKAVPQNSLPLMNRQTLVDAKGAFEAIRQGKLQASEATPDELIRSAKIYPINETMNIYTDIVFTNGRPFGYD
ncbi:MBL fold metallo-hydrolase [Mesorhizobium sp. 1M-11]|uniref:MBL fold metallo-hydrolase n=1 Tax=Mesorhizobium sp. 1M-11 TaxID=1529006 RepID=UPI0006C76F5A|nr:MBL fold metallo-hydrolase [Mesorhizobium sp. 1M-11]